MKRLIVLTLIAMLAGCAVGSNYAPIYDMDIGQPPQNYEAVVNDYLTAKFPNGYTIEKIKGPSVASCEVHGGSALAPTVIGTFHGHRVDVRIDVPENTVWKKEPAKFFWFHDEELKGVSEVMPQYCKDAMAWR